MFVTSTSLNAYATVNHIRRYGVSECARSLVFHIRINTILKVITPFLNSVYRQLFNIHTLTLSIILATIHSLETQTFLGGNETHQKLSQMPVMFMKN